MKKFYFTSNAISLKLFLFVFLFIGCDKNDSEIQNNYEPSIELLNDIVKRITNLEYSMFVGGDMGILWIQQAAKTQYNDEGNYIPRQSVIQYIWDDFYEDVIFKSTEMYDLANDEENDNIMAISLVLKAYGFSRLTDLYGDIPFIDVPTSTPVYELQENIYPEIFDMLDNAIDLFNTSDLVDGGSDILYNGDVNKWLKFANSLKFRCLMRVSSAMPVSAELQALINSNNLFQSNGEEAKRLFSGVSPDVNPIYKTIIEDNRLEWKASATIIDFQLATNDPRLPNMFSLNNAGIYQGWWNGNSNTGVSSIGDPYLSPTLPAYLLSYAELEFLKAEAAQKGYVSGSASDYYNAGISASFDVNEVSDNGYIASNSLGSNALQQIGIQKWLALFTQGIEAWTEYRRSGYPILYVSASASLNEIPSRLNYPYNEPSSNTANYNAAVQSQGEDNLTTKMWWMQ